MIHARIQLPNWDEDSHTLVWMASRLCIIGESEDAMANRGWHLEPISGAVESVGQQSPASGRGGRHRRLDAGQSRLQRRFFGVIERGLHHCAPLALEALKHLICGGFAHPAIRPSPCLRESTH